MDEKEINELAEYYDTHDTSTEMKRAVEVEPSEHDRQSIVYSVRLSRSEVQRLRHLAAEHGEKDRSMVKRWVQERLAEEDTEMDEPLTRFRAELLHRMSSAVDDAAHVAHLGHSTSG